MLFLWDVMSWDAEKKRLKVQLQLKNGLLLSTGSIRRHASSHHLPVPIHYAVFPLFSLFLLQGLMG